MEENHIIQLVYERNSHIVPTIIADYEIDGFSIRNFPGNRKENP